MYKLTQNTVPILTVEEIPMNYFVAIERKKKKNKHNLGRIKAERGCKFKLLCIKICQKNKSQALGRKYTTY